MPSHEAPIIAQLRSRRGLIGAAFYASQCRNAAARLQHGHPNFDRAEFLRKCHADDPRGEQ